MPKRQPTPHDNDAGIILAAKNPLTGNFVCLYDGEEQGLDGKYALVCIEHSTTLAHSNKRDAAWFARNPAEWCEDCMQVQKDRKALVEQITEAASQTATINMNLTPMKAFVLTSWNYEGPDQDASLSIERVILAADRDEAKRLATEAGYDVSRTGPFMVEETPLLGA